jgi:hypothetical protein
VPSELKILYRQATAGAGFKIAVCCTTIHQAAAAATAAVAAMAVTRAKQQYSTFFGSAAAYCMASAAVVSASDLQNMIFCELLLCNRVLWSSLAVESFGSAALLSFCPTLSWILPTWQAAQTAHAAEQNSHGIRL